MAGDYIEVFVESDAQTLADNAIDTLRNRWIGWEPNEGDLEVVQIETLAPMAQYTAETAARVPPTIFSAVGMDLYGVPYLAGRAATQVTFTLTDTFGHIIPAGAELNIDGYAFTVDNAVTIEPGTASLASVSVTAATPGSEANGLGGGTVAMISSLAFIADVATELPTTLGADAETDDEYRERLARELQLRGATLVTLRDYELMGRSEPGVGRILAVHVGARHIRVVITDDGGEPALAAVKAALLARYQPYLLVNTTIEIVDATYTTVDVDYTVKAYEGGPVDLIDRINERLTTILAPGQWGVPKDAEAAAFAWTNQTTVRRNKLIDLIGDVTGVDYVDTLTIGGTLDAGGNLVLNTGTSGVALTRPGNFTGTLI